MSQNYIPWGGGEIKIDDLVGAIGGGDDKIEDPTGSLVDLNNDGVADIYSIVKEVDVNGDGVTDYVTELIDDDLDGKIEIQSDFSDQDGDGVLDTQHIVEDMNEDGIIDTDTIIQQIDSNRDGIIDTVYQGSDLNLDGKIDFEQVTNDINGDGVADVISQTEYIDSNKDGIVDTISFVQDQNGDGYVDVSTVAQDLNMDGLFEVVINSQNNFTPPESEAPVYDPNSGGDGMNFDPNAADDSNVIGDPEESMESWHLQETDSSCAVAAQEFVLEDLLDREFTESELRDFASQNGWYSENGTPMEDVGNILEAFGLNVEKHQGGTVQDIQNCLENGGNVIVGVDADEIWYGDNDTYGPGDDANHALEVIGIDYSNPDQPMVILNDSGNPNGCGSMVPLDLFMDAWEDSGNFMVEAYN
jgi:hypothetical protein